MNCPKCGNPMQTGFLQSGYILAFNKTRHKISLNPKTPEDVMIFKSSLRSGDFNGLICKKCGLILFDYKNPLTR